MPHFNNSEINVVGTYYTGIYNKPDLLNKIVVGEEILLFREPYNPHDSNAVSVRLYGEQKRYGYIPIKIAARLAPILDRGSRYECFVKEKRGRRQPQIIISLTTYPISRPKPPDRKNGTTIPTPPRTRPRTPPDTPTGNIFKQIANFYEHCRIYNGVSGIYIIWNRRNKSYVGQSKNVANRWRVHKSNLSSRCHGNKGLQNDWVQMGASEFRFDILERVEPERLDEREKFHIERLNTYLHGYNQTPDGQGNPNRTSSVSAPVNVPTGKEPKITQDPPEEPITIRPIRETPIIKIPIGKEPTSGLTPQLKQDLKNDIEKFNNRGAPVTDPTEKKPKINKAPPEKPIRTYPIPRIRKTPEKITIYRNPDGTRSDLQNKTNNNGFGKSTEDMVEKYQWAIVATLIMIPFMLMICFPIKQELSSPSIEKSYPNHRKSHSVFVSHEIQEGETLSLIANKYHTSVEQIVRDNDIKNKNIVYQGELLKIILPGQG